MDKALRLTNLLVVVMLLSVSGYCLNSFDQLQEKHKKRFFTSPDGQLYVAEDLPLYFFISSMPDINDTLRSLDFFVNDELQSKTYLSEGKTRVILPTAVDSATKKAFPSGAAGLKFVVDGTAPVSKHTFSGAPVHKSNGITWFGRGLVFTIKSSDNLSGVHGDYISVNGAAYKTYASELVDFKNDLSYSILYYSADNVGNVEEPDQVEFVVDVSPPTTSYELTGVFEWNVLSPDAEIVLSSEDNLSGVKDIYYMIDDSKTYNYKSPISPKNLTDGKHTLTYFSADRVENVEDKHVYEFSLDRTPPDLTFEILGDQYTADNTIYVSSRSTIKLKGTDNTAGIENILYQIDGGMESYYSEPFALPSVSGIHTISYRSVDIVENQSQRHEIKVYTDFTAPNTTFDFTGSIFKDLDISIINRETDIILTSSDMEAGLKNLKYRINNEKYQVYSDPINIESDGEYVIDFFGTDLVDNVEEKKRIKVRVDNSPRQAAVSAKPTGMAKRWYFSQDTELLGSTELPFYIRICANPQDSAQSWLLDLGSVVTEDTLPMQLYNAGVNDLIVTIGDDQPQGFEVNIEEAPPQTEIEYSGAVSYRNKESLYFGRDLMVEFNGSDPDGRFKSGYWKTFYSIDGAKFLEYEIPVSSFSREKNYSVRFYSLDNVGNIEDVQEEKFIVDLSAPMTKHIISGSFYGNTLSPGAIIELQASDNLCGVKEILYSFDEETAKRYTGKITGNLLNYLSDGEHKLFYYSIDNVGNSENKHEFKFYYDKVPPQIEFKIIGDTYAHSSTTYISTRSKVRLSAADLKLEVKNIIYSIDGQNENIYSSPFSLSEVSEGGRNLQFYCIDIVNNYSSKQTERIILDKTAPRTSHTFNGLVYESDGQKYLNEESAIALNATDNLSGIKSINYRLNNGNYNTYRNPVKLNRAGKYVLQYFSVDNVSNREKLNETTIYIDNNPPEIMISYSTNPMKDSDGKTLLLPQGTSMYLSASDKDTEIDRIMYSINGEEEVLYRTPLTRFEKDQVSTVKVIAIDRLQNRAEKTIRLIQAR